MKRKIFQEILIISFEHEILIYVSCRYIEDNNICTYSFSQSCNEINSI